MYELMEYVFQTAVQKEHCRTGAGENEQASTGRSLTIGYSEPLIYNDHVYDHETTILNLSKKISLMPEVCNR